MTEQTQLRVVEGSIVGLIGLLALVRIFLYVKVGQVLSPLDESVYVDYVLKVPSQLVVHQGEQLSDAALKIQACHTWAQTEALANACATGDVHDLSIFPQNGITSADLYTPVYPTITWAGMQLLLGLGAANELLAMRYTGAIWLALAAMGMWGVGRMLNLSPWASLGAAMAIAGATPVRWANGFVTPDATAMLAGVAILGVGTWWIQREMASRSIIPPAIAFTLTSAFFTAIKLQNFYAVVVAGFWILFARFEGNIAPLRKDVMALAGGAALALSTQAFWFIYRAQHAVGPFPDQHVVQGFSYGFLAAESLRYIPGIGSATGAPELLQQPWLYLTTQWMLIVVALGTVGSAVSLTKSPRFQRLAFATLTTAIIGGPALVLASSFAAHGFIPSPERYGLSLFPAAVLGCAALFDQHKPGRISWAGICTACTVIWIINY
ncbi:hypothetical protein [Stomatohabitans albus]|uniref:hypothetical protein n=1 Tax=Stomatohabitans albus TaxID=3110766 RepID=UPI00300C6439